MYKNNPSRFDSGHMQIVMGLPAAYPQNLWINFDRNHLLTGIGRLLRNGFLNPFLLGNYWGSIREQLGFYFS